MEIRGDVMQEYVVANSWNGYSDQLYPTKVHGVQHEVGFTSAKYPNGMLRISGNSIDGYFYTLLKCYISKKGRYAIWGKRKIYEGYSGDIVLVDVPKDMVAAVKLFVKVKE